MKKPVIGFLSIIFLLSLQSPLISQDHQHKSMEKKIQIQKQASEKGSDKLIIKEILLNDESDSSKIIALLKDDGEGSEKEVRVYVIGADEDQDLSDIIDDLLSDHEGFSKDEVEVLILNGRDDFDIQNEIQHFLGEDMDLSEDLHFYMSEGASKGSGCAHVEIHTEDAGDEVHKKIWITDDGQKIEIHKDGEIKELFIPRGENHEFDLLHSPGFHGGMHDMDDVEVMIIKDGEIISESKSSGCHPPALPHEKIKKFRKRSHSGCDSQSPGSFKPTLSKCCEGRCQHKSRWGFGIDFSWLDFDFAEINDVLGEMGFAELDDSGALFTKIHGYRRLPGGWKIGGQISGYRDEQNISWGNGTRHLQVSSCHGGITLGRTMKLDRGFSMEGSLMLGMGRTIIDAAEVQDSPSFDDPMASLAGMGNIRVQNRHIAINPSLQLNYHLQRWLDLHAGIGYLGTLSGDWETAPFGFDVEGDNLDVPHGPQLNIGCTVRI